MEHRAIGAVARIKVTHRMNDCSRSSTSAHAHVLVVNDDRRLAESVQTLLSDEGYEARCAADGGAAIATLACWTADVILLDLMMPGLDGFQFLRHRAANPELTKARVIIWSSAAPEEFERALTLGADECLPGARIGPDRLLAVINDSMGERIPGR